MNWKFIRRFWLLKQSNNHPDYKPSDRREITKVARREIAFPKELFLKITAPTDKTSIDAYANVSDNKKDLSESKPNIVGTYKLISIEEIILEPISKISYDIDNYVLVQDPSLPETKITETKSSDLVRN